MEITAFNFTLSKSFLIASSLTLLSLSLALLTLRSKSPKSKLSVHSSTSAASTSKTRTCRCCCSCIGEIGSDNSKDSVTAEKYVNGVGAAEDMVVDKQTGASMMEQLVPEITTHALSYLDYPSLCRLSMTNSLMRKAANDDNAWKALYHKDFTLEQGSVTPVIGWKAYYAVTRAIVNVNTEFINIIRERSLQAMSQLWLNSDYVKCTHASGENFSGYNAVIQSWQFAFNWEQGLDLQVRGTCWSGYISTTINDGPGCLMLRCPDPSCRAAVGQDMINLLAPGGDKEKYSRYLLRSYIEDNRKTKWCPAPGCEYAIDFAAGSGSFDVSCLCSHSFCWNCAEEAHRPVDCGTVTKWILKNSAESENMNWILANSKPCPKCKRPIEKNQGCMHITCTPPCKFEFCWLCLGAWSDHGERTGGFYACNRYEAAKQEGAYDESERRREMAKNSLERYTHYYERWASNQLSRQKALVDLHQMQTVHLEKLSDIHCTPESQLKFIAEAWLQIVECRRVLKWTYAYGFYLHEHEHAKRQFFEYLQGEAESGLERLHQCAEKELQQFLAADGPSKEFDEFRTKLAGLTSVTKNYFENLVRALENGLADIDSQGACSKTTSSKNASVSKGKGGKGKGGKTGGSSKNGDD